MQVLKMQPDLWQDASQQHLDFQQDTYRQGARADRTELPSLPIEPIAVAGGSEEQGKT